MVKIDWTKLIISFILSALAAIIGSIPITLTSGIAWQDTLSKPFFAPPNWLFGPAWTILFILMAIAFYLVWLKWPARDAKMGMALYFAQLVLNVLWNFLFFGIQANTGIFLGLVEIVVLLAMIAVTISVFYRVDRRAAYLMLPYLLWVCFATCLNGGIWLLNR